MIKNRDLNKKETRFLSYLNNQEDFPFKGDFFKFLLVSSKASKESIYNFFDGFLINILIYECDNYYLVIYQNKEKLELENFIEMFNDDMGTRSMIFEGFTIKKDNYLFLQDFLDIFDSKYSFNKMYSKISDLVLICNNDRLLLNKLNRIVLDKYIDDKGFINLVRTLFKNNLNVSKTAKDLYMHRNTLNNKLNVFERETTLSIQNFIDAVAIYELLK